MARRLRYIPEGGALVEVTCRTVQGRFLLRPSGELNSIAVGVVARAQRLFHVEVHALVVLSNHYHLLVSVKDALQLASFMNYVNSNLAREAGRLHNWREKFWGRRYQAIIISEEETAQLERLRYLLSHGCKEGLVARPRDWPGTHSARALAEGQSLEGLWFDRTSEYAARARGQAFDRLKFATKETVQLEPMPFWRELSRRAIRERVADLISDIEMETAARHSREGTSPLGARAILSQPPHQQPRKLKKSLAPAFHAASRVARKELVDGYRCFLAAFRDAAERLKDGNRTGRFPRGSFPPRLPFVGWIPESTPG